MNAEGGEKAERVGVPDMADYVSIAEAARILDVAESTVWRWVMREEIAAYRIGPRRIWLRREDLGGLVRPVRGSRARAAAVRGRREAEMTAERQAEIHEALARIRLVRAAMTEARPGASVADAVADIRAAREERTRQLGS